MARSVEINVLIEPDNTFRVAVPSGVTFEEAKAAIDQLVKELGVDIPFTMEGEVEQHRHDPDEKVRESGRVSAS